MNSDIAIHKPAPIAVGKPLDKFNRTSGLKETLNILESGMPVLVSGFYSDGLLLLREIHHYLKNQIPHQSFKEQREYRSAYRKLSNLVLLEIKDQKLCIRKSPVIGWLERFYADNDDFLLTFPQVQGLNSAWQWYQNGISVPVLRNKLHTYYGVYFPTRFEHLLLFDNWLKRYSGPKKSAIDVGVGSGVLSMQMIKHGFQKVYGTDTNPNAIFGLTEFMGKTKLSRKLELDFAHLFGKWKMEVELIVFNPPWLPESHELDRIGEAIYYNECLFPDFFAEAYLRLLSDGKLLIIFSNLAQITNVTKSHPIEKELAENERFQLERCYTKKVKVASAKTNRDQHWRADEEVELWVLVKK